MAGHILIETYLAELRAQLPTDVIDELADGLTETFERRLKDGLSRDRAATAAVAEFGSIEQITTAFIRQAPGRRAAVGLLASGPVVGVFWGGSLIAAQAWTWPIPLAVAVAFGAALIATAAMLLTVAVKAANYARTRLTAVGGTSMILLDIAMLATVATIAPTLAWPMALAVPASLARIGYTMLALPRILAS